jgi:hypothetical protein
MLTIWLAFAWIALSSMVCARAWRELGWAAHGACTAAGFVALQVAILTSLDVAHERVAALLIVLCTLLVFVHFAMAVCSLLSAFDTHEPPHWPRDDDPDPPQPAPSPSDPLEALWLLPAHSPEQQAARGL